MKILKEDIKSVHDFQLSGEIDFSAYPIDDVLIKKIISFKYELISYVIDVDEISINLKATSEILYLDAKTLDELILKLNFQEDIPFSFNKKIADELDIDYFEEELDLELLLFDLLLINIPPNYSENKNDNVFPENHFYESNSNPFKKILKNKED